MCASLNALVISGASSNNFLQKLGKQGENTDIRNQPLKSDRVHKWKDEKIFYPSLCVAMNVWRRQLT